MVTVRAVLGRAPFDWISPGAEDLIVTGMLMLDPQDNQIELALTDAPEQLEAPATEEPLPVRVGCNCDGLSHAEIVILSADGEVLQTETLNNPDLPVDLELDALAAGLSGSHGEPTTSLTGPASARSPSRCATRRSWSCLRRLEPRTATTARPTRRWRRPSARKRLTPSRNQSRSPRTSPNRRTSRNPSPKSRACWSCARAKTFQTAQSKLQQRATEQPHLRSPRRRDFDWFVFELTEASPLTIWTTGETDTRCEITRDGDRATAQDDDSGSATQLPHGF